MAAIIYAQTHYFGRDVRRQELDFAEFIERTGIPDILEGIALNNLNGLVI